MLTLPSRTLRRTGAYLALAFTTLSALALAQPTNPPANGPRKSDPAWHALRNATVHVKPGATLEHATVVIRDGVIQAVLPADTGPDGKAGTADDVQAPLPIGPRVWDCTGMHIYPGFIDPYVEVDAPAPDPRSPGLHWSAKITPQRKATDGKGIDDRAAERLRAMGFTSAAISPRGGIFRGQSAVVSLAAPNADASIARPPVYREGAYQSVTLDTGRGGRGGGPPGGDPGQGPAADPNDDHWPGYPNSQMGSIALIRQTLIDADWGLESELAMNRPSESARVWEPFEPGASLHSLFRKKNGPPFLFNADDELEVLRAVKIAAEFKREAIVLGSGLEFRRLPAIVEACIGWDPDRRVTSSPLRPASETPIILPLNFPRAPDVASTGASESVELRELMTWEQAPTNPRRLHGAGLTVALTTSKLREGADFRKNLARALRFGLDEDVALAMLTTNPAEVLGVSGRMGTVEKGKAANLIVSEGSLFVPEKAPKARGKKDDRKADTKDGEKPDKDAEAKPAEPEAQPAARPEGRRGGRGPGGGGGAGGPAGGRGGGGTGGAGGDSKDTKIRDVWIDGLRHEINPAPAPDLAGTWTLTTEPKQLDGANLEIEAENAVTVKTADNNVKAQSVSVIDRRIAFVFDRTPLEGKGFDTLSGVIEGGVMFGTGIAADGTRYTWKAVKTKAEPKPKKEQAVDEPFMGTWKIFEGDGKAAAPDDPHVPTLIIGGDGIVIIKVGDKQAHSKFTKVAEGRMEYIYDNAPLGKPGDWEDAVTVDGDVMTGTSKKPDGTNHTWKARRIDPAPVAGKGDKKPGADQPVNRQTMTGKYVMVAIDDKSGPIKEGEETYIEIRDDKSILLSGRGMDMKPDDIKIEGGRVGYTCNFENDGKKSVVKVQARRFGDLLIGSMVIPDGSTHSFKAARVGQPGKDVEKNDQYFDLIDIASIPEAISLPFGPYALDKVPEQPAVLRVTNVTVWTSAGAGVINNGEVVVEKGKITYVGPTRLEFLSSSKPVMIDASGKHVTAGLIDCHSHTGISKGVNESGQTVTAEVRIEDVTNPDSISWYRQLAGGITAVNNLHGSANPIGGQNCVNKNRWGALHPDDLHFEGAKPGIKFALGENVKQSNSSGLSSGWRYPQTRMGVETLIRDRFTAAREYAAEWMAWKGKISAAGASSPKALAKSIDDARGILDDIRNNRRMILKYNSLEKTANAPPSPADRAANEMRMAELEQRLAEQETLLRNPPHRDLELEALAEILAGKRLVHCHSYRQDEILMLARLSKEFGFKLGTYQHGLECYKVATEVGESAIGASLFSDWWAYKVEVQDAIPQAGPILYEQGVIVSYNSDSDELARRLNTEAGKAVKYGGLKPEEALKFVTINPAKQLMIDSRVGSLEAGKDADFAIWSGDPLSVYSKCEATYVDGRCYFSLEQDKAHREKIAHERSRLIQKALFESVGDGKGGKNKKDDKEEKPADAAKPPSDRAAEARRLHYLDLISRGLNPQDSAPGECGCDAVYSDQGP